MKLPDGISKAESPFKPDPLNKKNHTEDLHLIGEGLPVPSVVMDIGSASVGFSPIPAREDHIHGGSIVLTPVSFQIFTATGTWTKPAGLLFVIAEGVGSGGGSGGIPATAAGQTCASGGGGSGAYCRKRILAAALGATETVTIGTVGAAGAATPTAGGNATATTFGAHWSAGGGLGSPIGVVRAGIAGSENGGNGGTATGGDINIPGSNGGVTVATLIRTNRAQGAHSLFSGLGDANGNTTGAAGTAGKLYGGGASGAFNQASQVARAGAAGALGICIVWEFF